MTRRFEIEKARFEQSVNVTSRAVYCVAARLTKKPSPHNERRRGLWITLREANQQAQLTAIARSSLYP